MSLVVNPSLEQEPKRRKISSNSTSSSKCGHWFSLDGICMSCNSKVDKTIGRSFNHLEKGIQLSGKSLSYTKCMNSRISWIEHKKLHLVLDLDHTLVHTIRASNMSESDKYLLEEAGSRSDLWRFDYGLATEFLIKLRPYVHEFLREVNEIFCMSVYTKGGSQYAKLVLELIDPERVYFGDRVVTREESPGFKTRDLVLADERGIVIVDDTRSVWPDHQRNLLQIAKYEYFRRKEDLSLECEKEREESDDEFVKHKLLAYVLRFLEVVHNDFFSEKFEEEVDSIDVRPLLQDRLSRLKCKSEVVVSKV